MVEDYRIMYYTGTEEGTGRYETTKRGKLREIKKYVERCRTPAGDFLPEQWKRKALEAIEEEGEMELLESIKEHCRAHCAWMHKEKEVEEYAIDCLCNRSYRHWKDFKNTETIIWM